MDDEEFEAGWNALTPEHQDQLTDLPPPRFTGDQAVPAGSSILLGSAFTGEPTTWQVRADAGHHVRGKALARWRAAARVVPDQTGPEGSEVWRHIRVWTDWDPAKPSD